MFNLSVVNVASDAYRISINQIAEVYGCGDNSLSVKLQDESGNLFWGCHSYWRPEDYALFSDEVLRNQIVPAELQESLLHLYERLELNGNAQRNWFSALDELGLSVVETL